MKKLLVPLAIAFFGLYASAASDGFIFTTFRDEATPLSEQIYMGISEEGKQWDALNGGNPVLVSDVGEKGVRDSFLLRSHDGQKVWLIATDLCIARNRDWHRATHAGSRSIVIWESTDLVHGRQRGWHWSLPAMPVVPGRRRRSTTRTLRIIWCAGPRRPLATTSPSCGSGRPAPKIFARLARPLSMTKSPIT
jgi:hypothetical protein